MTKQTIITILGLLLITAACSYAQNECPKILYTSAPVGSLDYDIYEMDTSGSNIECLYDDAGDAQMVHWSTNLDRIVFSSNTSTTGRHELFAMDADGSDVNQITSFGDYWAPSSPRFYDNSTIWWGRNEIGEICSINIDGTGYSVLSSVESGYSIGQIDFCGSEIVYSKQVTSNARTFDLYKANLDFTGEARITNNSSSDVGPDYSAISNRIVYRKSTASNGYSAPQNIFTINLDGTDETQITFAAGSQTYGHPMWSEDGLEIVCYYRDGYQNDVIIMNPDGSNQRNITNTPDYNEAPSDWRNFPCASENAIAGIIKSDNSGLLGVYVLLYDNNGNILQREISDNNGEYSFTNVMNGDYTVEVQIPMGFSPESDPVVATTMAGADIEINFNLAEAASGKATDLWWWKRQFQAIYNSTPLFLGITENDVGNYCAIIFNHFYNRDDGFAIQIEGVTYMDASPCPLDFNDIYNIFLGNSDCSNAAKSRKHLLIMMLNVASGRLSQQTVVSNDGATASQAIAFYANEYLFGDSNDWTIWYNLMKIGMGWKVSAGTIDLTTPNVMYKQINDYIMPEEYTLSQNFPNPFNPTTSVSFRLPNPSNVELIVYNVAGQRVKVLADGLFNAGTHVIEWDAANVASGIYFYRINAGEFTESKKMILLK